MKKTLNMLFVYGTLREDPQNEMYHVLARHASFIAEGKVQGRLFDLGEYPGMILSKDQTEQVIGEVYVISPERLDEVLATLDDYEGCGSTDPLPHEYRREKVNVTLTNGQRVTAWTYLLNRQTENLQRIPFGDYLCWRKKRDNT